jgi:hypothetical protein
LFGPSSGRGEASRAERLLAESLRAQDVAVCRGLFGGSGAQPSWKILDLPAPADYVGSLRAAVAALTAWGAELLVCVGGDGLASYAADAMLASSRPAALLGVAAGTINVGPIVTMDIGELAGLDPASLRREKRGAVEVLVEGIHLAYGFNDIVIGDTFLGMLGGRTVNLSAKALLDRGEKLRAEPCAEIAGPSFSVRRNGAEIVPGMRNPAQIIVSPLGPREFYARAIAGILCEAPYMRGAAALALFDTVIVAASRPGRGMTDFSASEQMLFGPEDIVEIGGLTAAGQVIVDGNPFARTGDRVQFRSAPDLIEVARPSSPGKEAQDGGSHG